MSDPRIEKLADLLVNYSVEVKPGDQVILTGTTDAWPLVRETYRHIIRAGGNATLNWSETDLVEILLKEGNEEQLQYVSPAAKITMETFDCLINIGGSKNTRQLTGIDLERMSTLRKARGDLMRLQMERSAAGDFRWVGTLFPTNAHAQDADMSLEDFEHFVYGACFADRADPVSEWRKLSAMQQRLVDWLQGKKHVRVAGPHADLELSIEGRTFINSDGKRNMPSGEIFTGPVENSANGWVDFTYPAIVGGLEVEGIHLEFEEGKVVKASAKKNQPYLLKTLDTDEGARYLGEFAIGTNNGIQRFTRSILFDEKIGGTIHMALGAGYPETGSVNRSSVHWDMICGMQDGGKIWVDDELFYDSGKFVMFDA
jgi:aminopeptidase